MKTMKTTAKKILILLLMASGLRALGIDVTGNSKVVGKVSESQTRTALEYVSVTVYKATDSTLVVGTITQKDGTFTISGLDSGKYFVELSFTGFEKKTLSSLVVGKTTGKIDLGDVPLVTREADKNRGWASGQNASKGKRAKHESVTKTLSLNTNSLENH
jgi:hypothetical protein